MAENQRTCTFDGCARPHEARGYCNGHYLQQRRGKPLTTFRHYAKHGMTLRDLLDLYTDRTGDCWVWTASTDTDGYGKVRINNKMVRAHRVAYELAYGPIPEGLIIDHRCHNPACVRPDHLRLATSKQNQENRAGAQANSKSGVRGVAWDAAHRKWRAQVQHNGQITHLGGFATIAEAEAVAIAKRLELFTHNDADSGSEDIKVNV